VRVLALTPNLYGISPGQRTSIELWQRALEPAGISMEFSSFETDELHAVIYEPGHTARKALEMARAYAKRLPAMRRLDEFDAVLVYREAAMIGPALLERWAARGKPIIYQLDDPLYVPYRSPFSGYLSYLKFFGKVRSIIRMSSAVIVNSPHHREYASRFNDNIWEVPSIVDETKFTYRPRRKTTGRNTCVGWSGSASTVRNLQVIRDVLREVGSRPDVDLRFIGAANVNLPDVDHEAIPWRAETEVDDLRQFDIGLVPLPTDEWTKRKFYLKLVQYMALGIPAVATPLGSNPIVVDDGRTGFLASTDSEWLAAIARLVDDEDLRLSMQEAAAEEAARRYTLAANAERIVAAFRSAVRR
jgi:glycosyltransferase involved in cell wall biosynthesis